MALRSPLALATLSTTLGCGGPAADPAVAPTSAAPVSAAPAATTAPPATTPAEDPAGTDATAVEAPLDPGEGSVDGPDVARSVSDQLTKVVGRSPDSVTCPNLLAKVGTAIRCELVDGADRYGVTVTSVEGTDVAFDIKVDDQVS
ncbi:uncharacterized protein DUF4333 [Pseudonocardia sediminis]|uniref:Uncharacterized protein DUF4333 n=1 Tax=Pseudonocardia sediminis TaxID=1397368 RepID=A0A4Q7V7W3_PSEST|nr:DUF4333 domain-containing protein [Pseudonocardia sediminis]RZT88913.1 uncharacterized protein DUF4333 [Pseudonocardia sediminis]